LVLVFFKKTEILPVLSEILALGYDTAKPGELNGAQVEALKMNILSNVEKALWKDALKLIEMAEKDSNIRVNTKAKQVLKILKN
jgi:hypothetical protein